MSECQAVRASVLTRDLSQLESDPLVATHLAGCLRCSADATMVRTATIATAETLNCRRPLADPAFLAQAILDRAVEWRAQQVRRWQRASWVLVAIAIVGWVTAVSERTAPLRAALGFPDAPYVTTVTLQCVSSGDAATTARPYLQSRGSEAVPGPANAPSVTLRGERKEVAQAEIAIAKLDGRLGAPPAGACTR